MGLELGLISSDLDAIKKKEHGDVDDCFREMLKLRLSFGTLQWSHLITALRQDPVNLAIVANNLAKIHEPDMVKEPLTGITSILLDEDQPKNPPAATQGPLICSVYRRDNYGSQFVCVCVCVCYHTSYIIIVGCSPTDD